MSFIFFLKILIVLFFLVMFWRKEKLAWGIGLLTVTTAFLLDIYLNLFGYEAAIAKLGFFFYVLAGSLLAGAAIWLNQILRPFLPSSRTSTLTAPTQRTIPAELSWSKLPAAPSRTNNSTYDRKMLYDQIRFRLGPSDLHDLLLDLQINENDVIGVNQTMAQLAVNIMDWAEEYGQTGALSLAVERILTPIDANMLPRPEKINADSPPTILRYYLISHYNLEQLWHIVQTLEIDWEQLSGGENKQAKVRELLLYLYRRNRISALIDLIQQTSS